MKIYPVVRTLSHLAASACWAACSSENPALFDDAPGMATVVADQPAQPPSSMQPPAAGAPSSAPPSEQAGNEQPGSVPQQPGSAPPTSEQPSGDQPGSEQPSDDDLPLSGGFPTPPVTGGAEPAPVPDAPQSPEPEGPVIVSVSPADGAVGVDNAQNIVIAFSAPMARDATEAAYQSESVPSSSVSFIWNDASTELTIVPDAPLAYPVGDDPAAVPVRRVSFFISASATDVDGRSLPAPFESSFSLLRLVELTSFAVQDRDLSGNFRSNGTYGAGQCARGQINMCVGDSRVSGLNEQYSGFISFELPALPDEARSVSAELTLEITGTSGNPFNGLGGLVLEHASFELIGSEAFESDALDEMGLIANSGGTGTVVSADVASAVLTEQAGRSMTQYRLRFEDETDADTTSDLIISAWDTQTLDISYLIP